jgi:S-adenosylmethionine:tRNA ribosyltransferase-isomerase
MTPTPIEAFDYDLPADRIAQQPIERRDGSRLLHVRPDGRLDDHGFTELPGLLRPGDLLVVNDTRVRAARLVGTLGGGGRAELLLLHRLDGGPADAATARFAALVRPARRLRPGTVVEVEEGGAGRQSGLGPGAASVSPPVGLIAELGGPSPGHPGAREVTLRSPGPVEPAVERAGAVPLPPYIRTRLDDPARYQTLFSAAAPPESAAAPTAGLHFTPAVLDALADRGVEVATVRLEVGLATFTPIRSTTVEAHRMHPERFEVPVAAAAAIAAARARAGRVVAVGTTVVRTLESRTTDAGVVEPGGGLTDLYLRPGRPVRAVDGLLTNFHQPRSSLLVLLAALIGERWRAAYDHALREGYRFLSFGDCMLCWRAP